MLFPPSYVLRSASGGLDTPKRSVNAILTEKDYVPYKCYYILRSRSHPEDFYLTNSLIDGFTSTVLAASTPPNEHKFCSYMVRSTFSSESHRQAHWIVCKIC